MTNAEATALTELVACPQWMQDTEPQPADDPSLIDGVIHTEDA